MSFIVFFFLSASFSIELFWFFFFYNPLMHSCLSVWMCSANNIKSYLCPAGKTNANPKEWLLPQFMCQTLFGPKGKALMLLTGGK